MCNQLFRGTFRRFILLLLAAGMAMMACQHSSKNKGLSKDESAMEELWDALWDEDSIAKDTDNLLAEEEPVPEPALPTTVDELFDDFAFAFDSNRSLRRQRVGSPLVVIADGDTALIDPRGWQRPELFLGLDYCTTLWNSTSQMAMTQDSTITAATVEHINLDERHITSYDFERDYVTKRWMLVCQRSIPFEASDIGNFLDFYRQWSEDSAFQVRHIARTLRFSMADENSEEGTMEGFIDAEQWQEFAPEVPQHLLTNIRYGQQYKRQNSIVLQIRGLSNGLQNQLTFRHEGGSWRLTAFEN